MENYTILEHTADIGIALLAESPEGLFRVAAAGFTSLLDTPEETANTSYRVELTANCPEELIVRWFNEMLFLLESESFLTCSADILDFDSRMIVAELRGKRSDRNNLELREIKSATYHQLTIQQEKDGWRAQIYLDL